MASKAVKMKKRPSYIESLEELLYELEHPGDFATQGVEKEHPSPGLWVNGVGYIAVPFLAPQASQLKDVCEQAPFGRGEDTIVDTSIRNALQLSPDKFQLKNPEWAAFMERVTSKACDGLGVPPEAVTAELYKLVLYEAGSFFVPHRDTEKADGMFGTLVIVLPSIYKGGDLVIAHAGQTKTFSPSAEGFSSYWAAFYADCKHKIKPIKDGHRLCLIYNLVQSSTVLAARPPNRQQDVHRLLNIMQEWREDAAGPEKLIYQLDYMYSPDGIKAGLSALKGDDRAAAAVLHEAEEYGLNVCIATFNIMQAGWGDTEDDLEVINAEYDLTGFTTLSGTPKSYESLHVNINDEVIPAMVEEDLERLIDWDENDVEEATGNQGATFGRSYSRACLVIWSPDKLGAPVKAGHAAKKVPASGGAKERLQSNKRKATGMAELQNIPPLTMDPA